MRINLLAIKATPITNVSAPEQKPEAPKRNAKPMNTYQDLAEALIRTLEANVPTGDGMAFRPFFPVVEYVNSGNGAMFIRIGKNADNHYIIEESCGVSSEKTATDSLEVKELAAKLEERVKKCMSILSGPFEVVEKYTSAADTHDKENRLPQAHEFIRGLGKHLFLANSYVRVVYQNTKKPDKERRVAK